MTTINGHDLAQRAGVSYRRIDYWTRVGYLTPVFVEPAFRGIGHPRHFDEDQVPLAQLMGQLIDQVGLTPKAAYTTALALIADGRAELGPFTLIPASKEGAVA